MYSGRELLEEVAQGAGLQGEALVGNEVGDEALVARGVLANHHGGLAHGGVRREGGFDFAQLDAEAAQLHLGVEAAEELELAIRQPAHLVTRAVEAGAGRRGEGVGDELLRGELRAAEVAASQANATQVQLAGEADGERLEVLIQHIRLDVVEGAADGDAARVHVEATVAQMETSVGP